MVEGVCDLMAECVDTISLNRSYDVEWAPHSSKCFDECTLFGAKRSESPVKKRRQDVARHIKTTPVGIVREFFVAACVSIPRAKLVV